MIISGLRINDFIFLSFLLLNWISTYWVYWFEYMFVNGSLLFEDYCADLYKHWRLKNDVTESVILCGEDKVYLEFDNVSFVSTDITNFIMF